ncbi:hypothetical protein H112_00221 [Trichophyton rubrum D6]|nr:hypothetical protein H107_00224 [Trichophyton rubrum CBS 202.88]KDB38566.1 hypothetical protein H112_00221 [Trichophyton rubrum D6]
MISIRASSGTFCLPILASRPLSRRATSLSGEDLAPSNARYAFVRHDLDFLFRVQIQIIRGDSLPSMITLQAPDSHHPGNGAKRAIDWMRIEGTGGSREDEGHAQKAVGLSIGVSVLKPQELLLYDDSVLRTRTPPVHLVIPKISSSRFTFTHGIAPLKATPPNG